MAEKMTWVSITYQYKPDDRKRPFDFVQEEELSFEAPYGDSVAALPIPAVGDSVSLKLEENRLYKVLTRHFTYLSSEVGLSINVNIVVTDLEEDEYLARLKQ
ncbi:hypothetical protein [Tunturiibacter lichenicola]|uniref:hypothetical protein n=1 Tax=Tunturiibacter lichenicola TaxID=2051959 RepID=UPI003D9BD9A7